MRLSVVLIGILLILAGLSLIIISANEIQFLNTTCNGRIFSCLGANFFGNTTPDSIYPVAYAILEIGILFTVTGAIITLLGTRTQPHT